MTIAGLAGRKKGRGRQSGITLIEVLISMVVLTIGLVGMLGVLGITLKATQSSQENSVAKTVADEALESILTARESEIVPGGVPWSAIANTTSGGIFLTGFQPVCNAGTDGIYGTADDCAAGEQTLQLPGPDGIFGTADDIFLQLNNYQRQIVLTPDASCGGAGGCNLMDVAITVQFYTAPFQVPWTYTLATYISEYR